MGAPADIAVRELGRLQRRVRRRALAYGLFGWLATAVPLAAFTVWLAGAWGARAGGLAAGLGVSLATALLLAAFMHLWRPWRRYAGLARFARCVEARGGFDNLVVAAEEAARAPARWPADDVVARELARRLDARAAQLIGSVSPATVHPLVGLRLRAGALAAGVAACIVLAAGWPALTVRGLTALADPLGAGRARAAAGLLAEPGPDWVLFGGTVALSARDFAMEPQGVRCELRFGEAAWTSVDARPEARTSGLEAGQGPGAGRRWTAQVGDIREDFAWRFRRGGVVTAVGKVAVRRPPILAQVSARIEPPAYTGLPASDVERLPALSEVPTGSRVTIKARAGHDLAAGWLRLAGGDSLPMTIDGSRATTSLVVDHDIVFTFGLKDGYGLSARDPLEYRLGALADQPPGVLLARPGDDGRLPLDGRLDLVVEASDDFGLAKLEFLAGGADAAGAGRGAFGPRLPANWLEVRTATGTLRLRARALDGPPSPLRAAIALEVDAAALDLAPGDVLDLSVEATDNRAPGKGQVARSATLRLVLPSAGSVLAAQADSARASREQLEDARGRSCDLDADLARLSRELLKNPVTDWARQQEIEAALARQQAMQKELAAVADELRRQMDELARGGLTSEEQVRKAAELADLLSPQSPTALEDLLRRLDAADGKPAAEDLARAMEEVTRAQKDLARRLDAALEVMKRMAEEQQLEGLTALLEDLMRRQQELADLSRKAGEADPAGRQAASEEIARRQEALARELDALRDKLEQALAARGDQEGGQQQSSPQDDGNKGESGQQGESSSSSSQKQALREALEKLRKQQAEGGMDKASRALQQLDPDEAARMQQQALRDLGSLYSVLVASQKAMQSALKMEQVASLRGLAADLLALSERQESLGGRIPPQLQDVRNVELTRQQHRLQKAAVGTRERLAVLAKEAPNRVLKLLEKLDGLIEEMGSGVRALDEGRAAEAREASSRSLAECNRIVIGLLTEAQMSGSASGGGGGQQSASEQLQELARQQAALNGATDELRQMLADRGISQAARAQMERLGQEQARLGQELGRIAEQERQRPKGDGDRLLGDLGELGRQMERVGGDLGDGQVDRETLQRQDRILGRLLDARNSVRERDYSPRRESRTAARTFTPQAGSTGRGADGAGAGTRERFRRLEDAPLEYRDLVRRYFAAIDSLRRGEGSRFAPAPELP